MNGGAATALAPAVSADPLEHPLRARIRDRIAAHPGILAQELAEQLGCNRSTLRHHLTKLQEAGIVQVVASKQRAHVFLSTVAPDRQGALAALQRGRTWELALEVLRAPGQAQCDLTRRLGMSRKILRKYVNRLMGEGLLQEIESPPFLTYYPTRNLQEIADTPDAAARHRALLSQAMQGQKPDLAQEPPGEARAVKPSP
jgi:predicted transcriptional regulator